jgi:hypothetical protein
MGAFDISDTLAPDSDQLDAIDLTSGPRIFTVKSVNKGNAEQPVQVHLVEFPRPWRPGKNMRRVLAACWGVEASAWAGRRVELYCDPAVKFGGDVVSGTRISKLSGIDRVMKVSLLISRGKSATYTVDPLPELTDADRIAALRAEWKSAEPDRRKVIEAVVAALSGGQAAPTPSPDGRDLPAHKFAGTEDACQDCGEPVDSDIHS